jgi:hypothetical protein
MFRQAPIQTMEQLPITHPSGWQPGEQAALPEHSPAPAQTMEQQVVEYHTNKNFKRLTGSTLLAHHKAFHYTRGEKVRTAGYTRLNKDGAERLCYTEYYEAVLKIKHWQDRQDLVSDRGGADCIKTMLFYAENRANYKKNDDEIKATDVGSIFELIHFIHHGKLIALYAPVLGRVTLYDPIKRSRSTKERMNRILMRYCGCQLFQWGHKWYVFNPMEGDIPFKNCMKVNIVPSYSSQFPE